MKYAKEIMKVVFWLAVFNLSLAALCCRVKHPELTESQLMLKTGDIFIWNF